MALVCEKDEVLFFFFFLIPCLYRCVLACMLRWCF